MYAPIYVISTVFTLSLLCRVDVCVWIRGQQRSVHVCAAEERGIRVHIIVGEILNRLSCTSLLTLFASCMPLLRRTCNLCAREYSRKLENPFFGNAEWKVCRDGRYIVGGLFELSEILGCQLYYAHRMNSFPNQQKSVLFYINNEFLCIPPRPLQAHQKP